jgi:hypothetical protein
VKLFISWALNLFKNEPKPLPEPAKPKRKYVRKSPVAKTIAKKPTKKKVDK